MTISNSNMGRGKSLRAPSSSPNTGIFPDDGGSSAASASSGDHCFSLTTLSATTVMIMSKAMEMMKQLFKFAQYKSHAWVLEKGKSL